MNRRRRIYEGKAKVLYEGPEPGTLVQFFKDKGLTVTEINKEEFKEAVKKGGDLRAVRLPAGRLRPHPGGRYEAGCHDHGCIRLSDRNDGRENAAKSRKIIIWLTIKPGASS